MWRLARRSSSNRRRQPTKTAGRSKAEAQTSAHGRPTQSIMCGGGDGNCEGRAAAGKLAMLKVQIHSVSSCSNEEKRGWLVDALEASEDLANGDFHTAVVTSGQASQDKRSHTIEEEEASITRGRSVLLAVGKAKG